MAPARKGTAVEKGANMSISSEDRPETNSEKGIPVSRPSVELPGYRWSPAWVSQVGCLKAAADYLDVEASVPWLFGVMGYAFLLNIHDELCPSGWHVFNAPLEEALPHAGLRAQPLLPPGASPQDRDRLKQQAWDAVREHLDAGAPCYAYDLEIGEYYSVYGYDEVGYYYSGPLAEMGKGPLPWNEYGDASQVGVLAAYAVGAVEPPEPFHAVRHALLSAVRYAREVEGVSERYVCGPEGYDQWMEALEFGRASAHGTAYNAACYHECRANAVAFLTEARARLGGLHDDLIDEAQISYREVAECLERVSRIFSVFDDDLEEKVEDPHHVNTVIEDLRLAKAAEEKGLWTLAALAEQLREDLA